MGMYFTLANTQSLNVLILEQLTQNHCVATSCDNALQHSRDALAYDPLPR